MAELMVDVDVAELNRKVADFIETGGGASELRTLLARYLNGSQQGHDIQPRLVRLPTAAAMGGVRNRLAYETFWRNPTVIFVGLSEDTRGSRRRIVSIVDAYALTYSVRLCGATSRLRHLFVVEPPEAGATNWKWIHKAYPPSLSDFLTESTGAPSDEPASFELGAFEGALADRLALNVQSRRALPSQLSDELLGTVGLPRTRERTWCPRVPQPHLTPDEQDLVADNVRWITIGKDPGKNALNRIREAGWDNPEVLIVRAQEVAGASIDDVKMWLTSYWRMFEVLSGTCRLSYCLVLIEDAGSLNRYLVSFPAVAGFQVPQ
jgi:hypothetical protein